MAIYRKNGAAFQLLSVRAVGRLYKLAPGPDGLTHEIELTPAEETARAAAATAHAATLNVPPPLTAEQRLAAIEARLPDAGGAVRPKP